MITFNKLVFVPVLIVSALLVSSCGGGGGGSSGSKVSASSFSAAEGLYVGTTDTNQDVRALVLDDGTYYVLYSAANDPSLISGVVQGTGRAANGSFTSTDAKDFNIENQLVSSATVSANYLAKQSMNGTVSYPSAAGVTTTFTSTYDQAYEIVPSLATIAGTYAGESVTSSGFGTSTLTVSATGGVSGSTSGGCAFSGSVAPRARGNVFDASVTFGGASCTPLANQTVKGIAYIDLPNRRLYAAALLADRSNGALFVGLNTATETPAPATPTVTTPPLTTTPPATAVPPAVSTPPTTTAPPTSSPSVSEPSPPVTAPAPAAAPFSAYVTSAPDDAAVIRGSVFLEIRGSSIENVELLPSVGYEPRLAIFNVASDQTMASLNLDTTRLPNGRLTTRVGAFNAPTGQAATEIIAMPTRTWLISNDPAPIGVPIPPPSVMPEARVPLGNLPYVDPQALVSFMDLNDTEYESLLVNEWSRVERVMHQYVPSNVVLYPPTPLGFSGPWGACMESHGRLACREAMQYMISVMRNK